MDPGDSPSLHSLHLSTSTLHKDNVKLSYTSHAILSGDIASPQQPLSALHHLSKSFWISRGNHFSLDFHFSFDESIAESEYEGLLARLAGAFARTKLWPEFNLVSAVVRSGLFSLSVCLSYDEASIGRCEGRGKGLSGYTSRLIPPVGISTLELHRVAVDLVFGRSNELDEMSPYSLQSDFVSIEDMYDSTQMDLTCSSFQDTAFHLVEGILRHDLLGIPKQPRAKRPREEDSITLAEICPAMFIPGYLKAMNERSSMLPSITSSLTRITRRSRSDLSNSPNLSSHATDQIAQKLWKLAQCRVNAKTTSKLSFLEHENQHMTRKEIREGSARALEMCLLDNDDCGEGFRDVEALVEDEISLPVLAKSERDGQSHAFIFSDL